MEYNKILTGLTNDVSGLRDRRPSAGRELLMRSIVADMEELMPVLKSEVLERVSREIVLDADEGIDYGSLAEGLQVLLPVELREPTAEEEATCSRLNESAEGLADLLFGIADALDRHHKDEDYIKLYEDEVRKFAKSRGRKTALRSYERWREKDCLGMPTMEDLENYRAGKLLKLFKTGMFDEDVSTTQWARHYPDEVVLQVPENDDQLSHKNIHKYYYALRKICDYDEQGLPVNPIKAGIYFYTHRKDKNAKEHRRAFLKYMTKIDLAQKEMALVRQRGNLPSKLTSDEAIRYWEKLKEKGFVGADWRLLASTTRKQAMYIAEAFAEKIGLKPKWKHFEDFWNMKNLAQEKWEMLQTGVLPPRYEEIALIFEK